MSEKQDREGSDEPATKLEASKSRSEAAGEEARQSAVDLVKQQRLEMQYQKDPDRPAMFTSEKFGRVELTGDSGETLLKGMAASGKGTGMMDRAAVKEASSNLHDLAEGGQMNGPRIVVLLAQMKPEERRMVAQMYKDVYKVDLEADLRSKLPPSVFQELSKWLPHDPPPERTPLDLEQVRAGGGPYDVDDIRQAVETVSSLDPDLVRAIAEHSAGFDDYTLALVIWKADDGLDPATVRLLVERAPGGLSAEATNMLLRKAVSIDPETAKLLVEKTIGEIDPTLLYGKSGTMPE